MSKPTAYNFMLLGNAVVEQAATDYRVALCEAHQAWELGREYQAKRWEDEIAMIEKFFCGQGIMAYSEIDGRALMERLQKEVRDFKYDIHALRKELSRKRQILYNMGDLD